MTSERVSAVVAGMAGICRVRGLEESEESDNQTTTRKYVVSLIYWSSMSDDVLYHTTVPWESSPLAPNGNGNHVT